KGKDSGFHQHFNMKRIYLILIFLLGCFFANAQLLLTQSVGNKNMLYATQGAFGADSGYVYRYAFADTSAANLGYLKNIPGITIRTLDDKLWMRSEDVARWINIGEVDPLLWYKQGGNSFGETGVLGTLDDNNMFFIRNGVNYLKFDEFVTIDTILMRIRAVNGNALTVTTTSGSAVTGSATTGIGINGIATSGVGVKAQIGSSSFNTVGEGIFIDRVTTATPEYGIGASLTYR